jgi:hypothetical protein
MNVLCVEVVMSRVARRFRGQYLTLDFVSGDTKNVLTE